MNKPDDKELDRMASLGIVWIDANTVCYTDGATVIAGPCWVAASAVAAIQPESK